MNGQIIGASNPYLRNASGGWGASGVARVTNTTNLTNTNYQAAVSSRARQSYNPASHGAKDGAAFEQWKEGLYDQTPSADVSVASDVMYGSVVADVSGTRQLSDQAVRLSSSPTALLPMPDLSDINYYKATVSATYTDNKALFGDGSANPDWGQPAYVEVWNALANRYDRLSGKAGDPPGVISGSAALIGTAAHPIRIHGPVTIGGDVAIKGEVSGQGTLYTGRNVHVIGDVKYSNPPSFTGADPSAIDAANEKKTVLALCARGSVMMGNTKSYSNNPLNYMKPPFTKERKDDVSGAIIPAFDATASDTGYVMQGGGTPKKYQSLFGDTWINANSAPVGQIDAVMYTNNVAGGLVGNGSAGFTINGSVISKDEAMVVGGGGRLTFNYDGRIKERGPQSKPLIDIRLPRTPTLLRLGWTEVAP